MKKTTRHKSSKSTAEIPGDISTWKLPRKSPVAPAAPATPLETQCCREKHWNELTIEEKVERTRLVVKGVDRAYHINGNAVRELTNMFERHQHTDRGKIVVSLPDKNYHRESARDRPENNDGACFF